MSQLLEQIAAIYKDQLITKQFEKNKHAIHGIKHLLQTTKNDSFVKIILDLNIQELLLRLLIKSNYSFSPGILKCIELLCSYKLYFTQDHAVKTAEVVLRNVFNLVADHRYDNILIESLKIITIIIENLNDYCSKEKLSFGRYLDTVRNLLSKKNNPKVICAVIKMFSALLLHEKFQNHIDNNIFNDIVILWQLSLQKLQEIFSVDAASSFVGTSKLCDSILRMLKKFLIYKKDNIVKFYENVKDTSVHCLKLVCIPYIAEFGLTANNICSEYLCFLKTLLKSDLNKDILVEISEQFFNKLNFTVITKYLDKIASISDSEEQENTRQLCLLILCEIIVNLSDMTFYSGSDDKCKKFIFKHLETISYFKVDNWLNLLKDPRIDIDTKFVIIKFCTTYYVYDKNLWEIKIDHLNSFIVFLKNFPIEIDVTIYFLNDLWLLFAVICCSFPEEMKNNYSLFKATSNLEKMISMYHESFDKILTYHPSIINWIFLDPFVKKELKDQVMNRWLANVSTNASIRLTLIHIVSTCRAAAAIVLDVLQHGTAVQAAAAADVLRVALQQGPLAQDQEFVQLLCVAVPCNIHSLSQQEDVKDRVVTCTYLLHLSSFVRTPDDCSLLVCSVCVFTSCIGSLGLSNILPLEFYTNAFDYANNILGIAKKNEISLVFKAFMNSEPVLYTLMTALISDNLELSIKASHLYNIILEYQTYHKIYSKNSLMIKNDFLIKLMSVQNIEQLELNLQILKILLFKTTKSVLDLEIDEDALKGLYLRCLNLVFKPGDHNLRQFGLQCLEGILQYSNVHELSCYEYLCEHAGNHFIILLYFDKETSRPIDRTFLCFIQCWLQFASNNKKKIYNKFSITSSCWKISLYQISALVVNESLHSESDWGDIINSILKQLFEFTDLLPPEMVKYLGNIQEKLVEWYT